MEQDFIDSVKCNKPSFSSRGDLPAPQTHLEVLEAEDVQDADGLEVLFAPDAAVESADDPVETLGVKCHGHGVPGVHRLHATH